MVKTIIKNKYYVSLKLPGILFSSKSNEKRTHTAPSNKNVNNISRATNYTINIKKLISYKISNLHSNKHVLQSTIHVLRITQV